MRRRPRHFRPPSGRERDSISEASVSYVNGQLLPNRAPQGFHAVPLGRQRGIAGELPLHFERMGRIELAIDIGMDEQARIRRRYRHDTPPGASVPRRAINRPRARASRDITVPIGTPVTSAISR